MARICIKQSHQMILFDAIRNDIREQLPEDSERFAKIDRTWREIMTNARTTPNVLQACAVPGLHSQLQDIYNNYPLLLLFT